ncbi:MAG: GGDEF domain-containing protein [Atribacterota bacterium]|jgi:diguanylate cyclase (GGDEF)-like protein|nr:GGDEF domain-containing protein [Atribacterota bacterium]
MKQLEYENKKISSLTGEFIDSKSENDFYNYMLKESVQHFRINLLAFSLLFLLLFVPDYFLITDQARLGIIFLIRILFVFLSIFYFIRIQYMSQYLYVFSTIYELTGTILFWGLLSFYEEPDVVIQQQGLIVYILVIFFIIPNRFITKISISLILTIGFFFIAFLRDLLTISSYSWGLLVFSIAITIFCAMTTRRINRLQRVQFQNNQILTKISTIDSLTGSLNRMKYDEVLEKEITRAQRYNHTLSGIMFDLDNFKEINDKHGHLEGDKALKKVASLIENYIRENDQLFRWGGEEFIILLPNTDLESAINLTRRIHKLIKNTDFSPVKKLTCSFGVTSLQEDDTAVSFTNRLDELQYQAKKKGKDCIVDDSADKNLSLFEIDKNKDKI